MPTFTLDGQQVPFEPGDSVIRAAWRQGIEIPHYCWHPGLSVAANCRMCLVHVESGRQMALPVLEFDDKKQEYVTVTKPKLQPACQFPASEDLVVSSTSDVVKDAQKAVQEFLLLNHPVDCPICDQAGECKLQDYYVQHQGTPKRKRTEPVHKPKHVRFGPTIVYDGERCITCTRCIRVCDELVGDHVLDLRERGNKNEIIVAPGRELDHDYTLMTEHVCPVGALTSRDFRFKARVWFLKSAPGVCTGCATGCNTHVDYDPRNGKVYRIRPRDNAEVNQFWMCDAGMMTYTELQEDRAATGLVGRGAEREHVAPAEALDEAAEALRGVDASKMAVVFSAQHSNEDNYVLGRFAKLHGIDKLYLAAKADWKGDDILRSADANPNRAGASLVAGAELDETVEDLVSDVMAGAVEAVVVLGSVTAEQQDTLTPLAKLGALVCLTATGGALADEATMVVPVASWGESHGTFVNGKGMAQTYRRAVGAAPGIEPAWKNLVALAAKLGVTLDFAHVNDVRAAMPQPGAAPTAEAADAGAEASA